MTTALSATGLGKQYGRRWALAECTVDVPEGRVPEQFMLGKAVFVYWPAGYRLSDALPFHISIIPNFGDMRWIH